MARDRSVSFDPSLKTTLNEKAGAVEVGSNWNMDNIERIRKSTSDMLSSIGEGMVAYATKMKERQIASDLQAVDSYRERLWSEAQNELENSPEINTEEKLKAFWERKSGEINDVINKDYKENARWLDSTQEYVEAMNGQMSAKAFVGFNRELIRKNKVRDNQILDHATKDALANPNDIEKLNRARELIIKSGANSEQVKMFEEKHEHEKVALELRGDIAYARSLVDEKARGLAIDAVLIKLKAGYYNLDESVLANAEASLLDGKFATAKEIRNLDRAERVGSYYSNVYEALNKGSSEEQLKGLGDLKTKIQKDDLLTPAQKTSLLSDIETIKSKSDKFYALEQGSIIAKEISKIKDDDKKVIECFDSFKKKYEYLKSENPTLYKSVIDNIEKQKIAYVKEQKEIAIQRARALQENETKVARERLKSAINDTYFDLKGTQGEELLKMKLKKPKNKVDADEIKDALRIKMNEASVGDHNRVRVIYKFSSLINSMLDGEEYSGHRRELFEELFDITDGTSSTSATKSDIKKFLEERVGKPKDSKAEEFSKLGVYIYDALKLSGTSINDYIRNPDSIPQVKALIETYNADKILSETDNEKWKRERIAKGKNRLEADENLKALWKYSEEAKNKL